MSVHPNSSTQLQTKATATARSNSFDAQRNSSPASLPNVDALLIPEACLLPPARRLVVLIPEGDIDQSRLAQRIWALASPCGLAVLYLGLCSDLDTEPLARRCLVTLAAITRDALVHVETRVYVSRDWIGVIQASRQDGDLIVCHREQAVSRRRLKPKPLSQALVEKFHSPVYSISGFYPAWPSDSPDDLRRQRGELTPLAIFLIFLGLQILIHLTTRAATYTALMSLSLIAEFGLIGLWNHFFNR